ncbi:hypothetical protein PENDEC_c001G03526 [Penicillium decumbens]|uniref:Uncharacterized protein n=1 Tax=Penicillium decumbens TaxID=69771 RepID=A0A1V6PQ53_PENDC|nr:hypothetical protein PENDEC_c001G03526 [Penicillium decumbens]
MLTSIGLSQPKQPKEPQSESTSGENKASQAPTLQAHTLLCHLQVYIFSQTYLVPELKDLAFEKFSAVLKEIERPKCIDEQLAVIDCLSLAFLEVQPYDKLREWLAQYAAWCLHSLRLQPDFHQLLQRCPALSCRMMDILNPAVQAPWDVKWPKYRVPSYGARGFYEEGPPHEEDAVS